MGFWYSKQKLVPPPLLPLRNALRVPSGVGSLVDFNKAEECYNQISIERKYHPANNMPTRREVITF